MKTKDKVKTSKKGELAKKNLAKIEEKVITNQKDLLYKYPTEANTKPLRKAFRTMVRRQRESLEKKILTLKLKRDQESVKMRNELEVKLSKFEAKYYAK
jgi:hypothetical protein